jgi:ribonuclease HI
VTERKRVTLISDGACLGNPGPGGWSCLLRYGDHLRELSGSEPHTTNNRMELTAVLRGLEALREDCEITIVTDSIYLRDGITRWIEGWKRNGWLTADRKPVKNRDLWEALERSLERHNVKWEWVRGHATHRDNIRADELATGAARAAQAGESTHSRQR